MYKASIFNNRLETNNNEWQIYNAFTKACIVVNDADYIEKLLKNENKDPDILSLLLDNGFILPEYADEQNALKYAYNKKYFSSNAMGLILMPTLSCNFKCPYCFEKPSAHLIKETSQNYFNAIENYIVNSMSNIKGLYINFFGGEPLLEKEAIIDFSHTIKSLSLKHKVELGSTIVTNGSLIDNQVLDALMRMNCSLIQITIDGTKESHDKNRIFKDGSPSFDFLMDKICHVAEYLSDYPETDLLVRVNLNNTTINGVAKTLEIIPGYLRSSISLLFRPVFETSSYHLLNNNKEESISEYNLLGSRLGYRIHKNQRKFLFCEACGDTNVVHVLPDLSLWKCINDFSFTDACIGQLYEDGSAKWDSEKIVSWYKYADFFSTPKCMACSYSPDCLGGCIRNYALTRRRHCASLEAMSSPYRI